MRKVLLVDDHPVVRQGIARILAAEIPDLRLVDAVDGASALAQLRTAPCDLILLDLTLPGDSGLVVLRKIRREFPGVPVLIVSMHPVDQFAQRSLQAGAVGYVTKDSDPQEIVQAVRNALAGERHVPAELQEAARLEREPPPHTVLSDREYQVLRMIGAGRTVSEIGAELGLSVKTVSTYRARILVKLELRTSAELIHYAVVNGLVP
ncbi:MAG TPA: response regulator transcription factor [Vicinamibacterales bacterium]|nr:response regulator transcription factor [Vicinamibacterales bacterium]